MTTHARRLFFDTARRMWGVYAVQIALVFLLSLISKAALSDGVALARVADIFAWTMASCWFLAFAPATLLDAREITRLPVSRREFWIARWWLAVAVPPVGVATALGLGTVTRIPGISFELVLLTLLFCTLYGGCYMALSCFFPMTPTYRRSRWPVAQILLRMLVIPLGGAFLPLQFAQYLPHTLAGLAGPALGPVVAAAGIVIASYFYQPSITARPSRPHLRARAAAAPAAESKPGSLSGLTLLFVNEGGKALAGYAVLLMFFVLYWLFFGAGTLPNFLHGSGVLIFADASQAHVRFPIGVFVALGVGASDVGALGDMRGLRVLPLSRNALAAITTGLAVTSVGMGWITLLAVHFIAIGTAVQSLRPELFAAIAGAMAMSSAVRLSVLGNLAVRLLSTIVWLLPAVVAVSLVTGQEPSITRAGMTAAGGVALVFSWWLNQRTLGWSRRIYKPAPATPFTVS